MKISIVENGYIQTDIYTKDTARVQYLFPSTSHPAHISRNIPYSLGYRLLIICSNSNNFSKRLQELKEDLISRRYHAKVSGEAFHKLKKICRIQALKKTYKAKEHETPLVTKFHRNLPLLLSILKMHWQVMTSEDPRLQRIFPKQSVVAYCKDLYNNL